MEKEKIFSSGADMIYLAACALHGKTPDAELVSRMELETVYKQAARHYMQAVTYHAIEKFFKGADTCSQETNDLLARWKSDRVRAVRQTVAFELEREAVLAFFEQNNVRYLPLKGIILQNYYPAIGMRQMSDNDILYDPGFRKELRKFMLERGYEGKILDSSWPDTYVKGNLAFEMHHSLFTEMDDEKLFHDYYLNIEKKLLHDKGCGCRLSDEDFYIYCTTHAYKHFSGCGTGVRSLMDVYVYLAAMGDRLDFDYIKKELEGLGIREFDKAQRRLAELMFSPDCINLNQAELSDEDRALAEYYIDCGVYGNLNNLVINSLKRESDGGSVKASTKFKYYVERIFPKMEYYKLTFPLAYRYKILIPGAWIIRTLRGIFVKPVRIMKEFETVSKTK